jgi:hypothetical protein
MTDEEKIFFCGCLMSAARGLGLSMQKEKTESGAFVYKFTDPMAKTVIKGSAADNEKDALVKACETLQNYLSAK